jgi:hypothetical protein
MPHICLDLSQRLSVFTSCFFRASQLSFQKELRGRILAAVATRRGVDLAWPPLYKKAGAAAAEAVWRFSPQRN